MSTDREMAWFFERTEGGWSIYSHREVAYRSPEDNRIYPSGDPEEYVGQCITGDRVRMYSPRFRTEDDFRRWRQETPQDMKGHTAEDLEAYGCYACPPKDWIE